MPASLDKALSRRIGQVETAFLGSLNDQQPLLSFESPWSTLTSDLLENIDTIDAVTGSSVYVTASRVSIVAGSLSDVHTKSGALESSLYHELGEILDSIYPGPDTQPHPKPCSPDSQRKQPKEPSDTIIAECPPSNLTGSKLSAPGVHDKWLLENLHCPFPTWRVKKELLKSLDVTPRSLDDWFSTARRKIGWIAFSKRHFKGNRCVTTDCTDHVLVKGKRDDKYSEEILRDLDEIKEKAERLYGSADGDGSSSFAKELEGIEVQTPVGSKSRRKQRQPTSSTSTDQSSSPSPSTSSPSSRKRSFAKESEDIEAQTKTVGSKSRRKQRQSTSSTTTDQSSSPSPSTSSSSSRKRSRTSSEESDTTCYSESSESDSHRASKRLRSISPTFSCTSQESSSSSTTSSSDSSDTISEIHTPRISPTHPNFPVEIVDVDDWIDDISASASNEQHNFLPDDADADAVYKPQSILSHKRASPDDLESDVRTKRARVDGPWPVPYEKSDSAIAESRPNDLGAQAGSTQPSPSSAPSPSATEEPAGAGVSPMYDATATVLQPPSASELDEETMDFFLSQMDFNIPQAPIPEWDENILRGVEVEVSQFDFASVGLGYGSGVGFSVEDDTYDTSSVLSYPSDSCSPLPASGLLSKLHAHVPEQVEATNTPNPPNSSSSSSTTDPTSNTDHQSIQSIVSVSEYFASTPLSLTSEELEFLESIGNTTQSPSPSTSSSPSPLLLSSSTGVKNSAVDLVQDGKSTTTTTPVPLMPLVDIDVVHSSDDDTERTSSDDSENVGTSQSQFIDRFVFV